MEFSRITQNGAAIWCVKDGDRLSKLDGDPLNGWSAAGESFDPDEVTFLPPCEPSQMIIVGWNYAEHTRETGSNQPPEPMIFPLSPRGVNAHRSSVAIPEGVTKVEHEAELVVVMGKKASRVKAADALSYVLGATCGNDVSARDIQNNPLYPNLPRAKAIDTFKPIGPYLVTDIDFSDLPISMIVNGETRQSARTSDMVFRVPELIEFITRTITLYPWDVIFTGTPKGCSRIQPGDSMTVVIDKVGMLQNNVV